MKTIVSHLTESDIAIMAERFWAKVNKSGPVPKHCPELGPCWIWIAGCSGNGYGCFQYYHTCYRASRLAWFLEYGKWPEQWALHHCDNRMCVRPSHLFDGDHTVNMQDAARKGAFRDPERIKQLHVAQRRAWNRRILDGMAC